MKLMKPQNVNWRAWAIGGFLAIFVFVWAAEVFDLPHLLLRAPTTPINWQEAIIESIVTMFAVTTCWKLLTLYERGWRNALEEARLLAITDDLTGALNRRECLARAEAEFNRAMRFDRPLSLAIMDLDYFKSVNDRYGHQTGDNVIKEFARVVNTNIRTQDVFGRTGGDEFLLVLVETGDGEAGQIAERIRAQWEETKRAIVTDNGAATISVGLVAGRAMDETLANCMRRADKALYMAKARGRNQVCAG